MYEDLLDSFRHVPLTLSEYIDVYRTDIHLKIFDYFLNAQSFGERYEAVRIELKRLVEAVSKRLRYDSKWPMTMLDFF